MSSDRFLYVETPSDEPKNFDYHEGEDSSNPEYYIKNNSGQEKSFLIMFSEFEIVIMPMDLSFKRMLYRKLLYTGITRAKKSLTFFISDISFTNGAMAAAICAPSRDAFAALHRETAHASNHSRHASSPA